MTTGIVIDLDGTVYREDELVPGARKTIETLREQGLKVYFLTNNATLSREYFADKLNELGIEAQSADIITSGSLAVQFLQSNFSESTVFLIGEQPFRDAVRAGGLSLTNDPNRAELLLVGLDRDFDYGTLTDALHALDGGATYVATNTDATKPSADKRVPSTGALLGAINTASGREPDYIAGKPSEISVKSATEILGVEDPSDWYVVGDRLQTDMRFGSRAGMRTILVQTGVHSGDDVDNFDVQPNHIVDSIEDVLDIV